MDNFSSTIQQQDHTPTSQETSQFSSHSLWHLQQQIIPQEHHYFDHELISKPLEDHVMSSDHNFHAMIGNETHEVMFKRSSSCIDFRSVKDSENSSGDHHQLCKRKKIVHRDIERQRRQDMASLYSSLRSLLPLEYLKAKRSISDQIQEAVNYIKHMEEKIRKMSEKRNQLKGLNNPGLDPAMEGRDKDSLTVKPCSIGVEVVINNCLRQQGFPLSRVVALLTQQGLNVVSCISTKVHQRMLHSITSEVSEGSNIDMSEMQQKLINSVMKRFAD